MIRRCYAAVKTADTMASMPLRRRLELCGTLFGCTLVVLALVIIWVARIRTGRDVYVSELGAVGAPTARWFEAALLLIVVGGSIVAFTGRDVRSRLRVLGAWAPAVSLWVSCGFFLVASQVTCTAGCPVPLAAAFTWQDFIHTLMAVLAFAAACWGMLQTSFARGRRVLSAISLGAAISVALIAATGGMLSVLQFRADFGSRLELVATTIAVGWLVAFGSTVAAGLLRLPVVAVVSAPLSDLDTV